MSKFYRDEEGHYWENRGVFGGRALLAPAPIWAGNINPYLFEGPNIIIKSHKKPLCHVPELKKGAQPTDDGNLLLTDDAKNELLRTDPHAEMFIRRYMMGKEFINNIPRWCLWMVGAEPADIRKCPRVLERIERVRAFRLESESAGTRKAADTPTLFGIVRSSDNYYLAIPQVSSEKRRYIPIGWLPPDVIAGNNLYMCPNATLYQFGILNSSVHMSWVRKISGRLKMDYRYSNTVDYNTFPFPDNDNPLRPEIEKTAQAILDARALYPRSSLADLYDERTMPPELRKAHRANDDAVMRAYQFTNPDEEDIVINLMYMYKELTGCKELTATYPNLKFWKSWYEDEDYEGKQPHA